MAAMDHPAVDRRLLWLLLDQRALLGDNEPTHRGLSYVARDLRSLTVRQGPLAMLPSPRGFKVNVWSISQNSFGFSVIAESLGTALSTVNHRIRSFKLVLE